MIKTTKKDFKLFKEECQKWIEILGLKDWEVHFRHDMEFEEDRPRASIAADIEGRVAVIYLSEQWQEYPTTAYNIKKSAFHEVCELMMMPLNINARDRYVTESQLKESSHCVVMTLENVLFSKY